VTPESGGVPETAPGRRHVAVLFVCMGNICRSPTAEAMLRQLGPQLAPEIDFEVDSAGTHGYHIDAPPDARSQLAARRYGIDMADLRSRRLLAEDFARFDWIVCMDEDNRQDALAVRRAPGRAQLVRLLDFAPHVALRDVPDPYYGEADEFARIARLIDTGIRAFIGRLRQG